MKKKGHFNVTIEITPKADSVMETLSHIGSFDVAEEAVPLVIGGSIKATCDYTPEKRWLSNGDPGYPAEYDFNPDMDEEDIEKMLGETYPEFEFDVSMDDFEEDEEDDPY